MDGHLEDALKRSHRYGFQIQQANTSFLHGEFLKMAALEFHHDNELFRAADRDAKLGVFQLAHGLRKSVDANAKAVFFKAVAQLVKVKDRKSTRLNSSHRCISYAVFCLKKKI